MSAVRRHIALTPLVKRPLASIIINNYNYERYVGAAIGSALAQSYRDTEVIVVDDGSTDTSRDIISRYPQVHVVLKKNEGQASAFDAGIRASSGEVVLFLDADDTLCPYAVQRAVEALRGQRFAKAHWPLREIDRKGRETGRILPSHPLAEGDLLPEILRAGIPRGWRHGLGHAYRREVLERLMPVRECGDRHGADSYLCVLAPIYGEIAALRDPLGCYRSHGDNYARGHSVRYRLERDARRYPFFLRLIEEQLTTLGVTVDTRGWYGEGSALAWTRAALALDDDLDALDADDSAVILVDNGLVGSAARPKMRPMMERDGMFDGPPANDRAAIEELERQRTTGATHVVIAAAAFWWLDHYCGFAHHLASRYQRVGKTESSVIYDVREQRHPTRGATPEEARDAC